MATMGCPHNEDHGNIPELLTVTEAASMLRVSKMTIYRLVNSGDIPGGKIGKSIRMRRSDVESYRDNALRRDT